MTESVQGAQAAVALSGVWKRFGRRKNVQALQDLSVEIAPGSALAVVGENGAGKSTLARIVAGLLEPDAGRVCLMGKPAPAPARRARTAFSMGDERSLVLPLSARENLRFWAGISGLPRGIFEGRLGQVAGALGIDAILDKRVADLSTGQRQRVVLARALLRDSPIFVLDEPTRSLDAEASRRVWDLLRAQKRLGRSVLLCTHRREEAEAVCDRILTLREGRGEREGGADGPQTLPDVPPPVATAPGPGGLRAFLAATLPAALRKSVLEERRAGLVTTLWFGGFALEAASFFFLGRLMGENPPSALGRFQGGYFPFLMVWLAFQGLQGTALHRLSGEIRRGQLTGTLEMTVHDAASPLAALLAGTLWATLKASLLGILLLAAWCLLGKGVPVPGLLQAACAALLAWVSTLGVGMASASAMLVFQRGAFLSALYGALTPLLAGGFYPTEILPGPLRALGELFPLTPALRLMRSGLLAAPDAPAGAVRDLVALALFAAVFFGAGLLLFRAGLRAACHRGALARY